MLFRSGESFVRLTKAGVTEQTASAGTTLQPKTTVPSNPPIGVIANSYRNASRPKTISVPLRFGRVGRVKLITTSKPLPVRLTTVRVFGVLLTITRLPVLTPVPIGKKTTFTAQESPGANEDGQLLDCE